MNTTHTVDAEAAGARLDAWLAAKIPTVSRGRIQKWIKAGSVTVNGAAATPHASLAAGAVVVVNAPDEPIATPASALLPRADISVDVVYEDDSVIVINKPSGLIVHPAVPGESSSLANALVAQYPEIANVGDDPQRPGIVHRLDREASGLLVVARTKEAFANLKAQFQAHVIKKEYVVLVDGKPARDADTIKLAIGRSSSGGKMAARPLAPPKKGVVEQEPAEDDKPAITHYRIEEEFAKTTLLTVRTETGRTHQIRVHFNALGFPVAGDTLYGTRIVGRFASPRLFLHAKTLGFTHPVTDAEMTFTAPLPPELESTLKKLRKV